MADTYTSKADDLQTHVPLASEANKDWVHLVQHCLDRYNIISKSDYRNKKIAEIDKSIRVYNQEVVANSELWEGATKVTMPLTTISCDNLEPRLVSGLIGKPPFIRFEMPQDQAKDEVTELLESWFQNELEDVVHVEEFARCAMHRLLQEGTVYALPQYTVDELPKTDFVLEDEIQTFQEQNPDAFKAIAKEVKSGKFKFENGILMDIENAEPVTHDFIDTVFEGGKVDLIPFSDVYIDDDVDDWEGSTIIRKVYPTYAELVNAADTQNGYMNIGPWLYDEAQGTDMGKDQVSPTQAYDSIKEHGKKTIECIECSLKYIYVPDDEDEKEQLDLREERLIAQIAVESGILVRLLPLREVNHKNEHIVKRLRLFPERGKSYGTSMAMKLNAIQEGATKTFNSALNISEICMIPWFLYEEKATGIKRRYKKGLKLQPGMGYPVDSVQGIVFPRFSINPDQMFNWINLWTQFWERLSSIGDLQIGRQSEKSTTATEVMAVVQEGNIKHNYLATSIRDEFLSVLRTIYDLYYQHMPFGKKFLWKSQEVLIPRSAMRRVKNFRLTGSTEMSNKLIERKEKETFYTMSAQDPNIDPVKRAQELVKAYGYDDVDEWVSPQVAQLLEMIKQTPGAEQMIPQVLQQMQAQAQQQQKMAQQGQPQQPVVPNG